MELDELKERLGRYRRVAENKDVQRTIKDLEAEFGINGSIFGACNTPHPVEYVFAREGIRTFINKLNSIADETERAIIDTEEQPQSESEGY